MSFLIAYDIADPKRLRRVARFMEKHGLRCQKSVFWYAGDAAAVAALLDQAAKLLNAEEDAVQAWQLSAGQTPQGLARGTPLPVRPDAVVLEPKGPFFLKCRLPQPEPERPT